MALFAPHSEWCWLPLFYCACLPPLDGEVKLTDSKPVPSPATYAALWEST